jgi:hypothetical protein
MRLWPGGLARAAASAARLLQDLGFAVGVNFVRLVVPFGFTVLWSQSGGVIQVNGDRQVAVMLSSRAANIVVRQGEPAPYVVGER